MFVGIIISISYSESPERFLIAVEKLPDNSVFLDACRQAVLGF
jgi:hypothetical protein